MDTTRRKMFGGEKALEAVKDLPDLSPPAARPPSLASTLRFKSNVSI